MDPFYLYVTIGMLILLVVVLVIAGVTMTKMQTTNLYPPTQNACPDYWEIDSSDPTHCRPVGDTNRGSIVITASGGTITVSSPTAGNVFTTPTATNRNTWVDTSKVGTTYSSLSTVCSKKRWADLQGIVWDGVTNYNGC